MTHAARTLGIALLMLLSSVFIVGVIAQESDKPQEPNVYGKVIDAATGGPLHAMVFIVAPDQNMVHTFETGKDGVLKIFLPTGNYVWEAEAEHYYPGRGEFRVGDKIVEMKIVLRPMEMPEEPEEPEVPDFTVAGMLINARTEEGVPGYIGFINQDGKAMEMETEEDGEFKALLPPGMWMWKAGARGYEIQEGQFIIEREPVRLMIKMVPLTNEEPEQPEKRGAYLIGYVMTPEGKPVPGALIFVEPMMREEEPPVRPGIPEDPPERPMLNDRDPTTRQSERDVPDRERPPTPDGEDIPERERAKDSSISFREFFAKFSEKIDEETLKRIFAGADVDGDGMLNEREIMMVMTRLKEMGMENDRERDVDNNDRMKPKTKTGEKGMFKIGLPFGEFVIMVKAEGFHPNRMPVRIHPRIGDQRIKIVLEPMEMKERERKEWGRSKVIFNMEDHNSDGNPEMVKFAADLNGDGINEIVYGMIDRNSDGNPESVEWVLDIPMEMWKKVMVMVMEFLEKNKGNFGEKWEGMGEEWSGEEGIPFDIEAIKDMIANRKDPNMAGDDDDPAYPDAAGNKESDDLKSGDIDSGISDKASSNVEDTPVLEIMAAIGILAFILAILIGAGIYIRKKSE